MSRPARIVVRRLSLLTGRESWAEIDTIPEVAAVLAEPVGEDAEPEPSAPWVPIWRTRGGAADDEAATLEELARTGSVCSYRWESGRICGRVYARCYLSDAANKGLTCAAGHFAPLVALAEEGRVADRVMRGEPAEPGGTPWP